MIFFIVILLICSSRNQPSPRRIRTDCYRVKYFLKVSWKSILYFQTLPQISHFPTICKENNFLQFNAIENNINKQNSNTSFFQNKRTVYKFINIFKQKNYIRQLGSLFNNSLLIFICI